MALRVRLMLDNKLKIKMSKLKTINKKAQTLIEVLVATGLITVALLGILSLAASTFAFGGQITEWTTAVALAREGIEVCQAVRGNRWLNENESWPFGLENGDWIANADATSLVPASSSNINQCYNCLICFDPTTKKYFQADDNGSCGSAIPTTFRRLINISSGDDLGSFCPDPPDDCEKKIRLTLQWTKRGQTYSISLEKRLTNWR